MARSGCFESLSTLILLSYILVGLESLPCYVFTYHSYCFSFFFSSHCKVKDNIFTYQVYIDMR